MHSDDYPADPRSRDEAKRERHIALVRRIAAGEIGLHEARRLLHPGYSVLYFASLNAEGVEAYAKRVRSRGLRSGLLARSGTAELS